ncbi:uncharacterized protein HMPREF1541_01648 [Cyphellophora europaea CBS 101466]|uniref:Uncharacterized protein n=1 Tax=Cyphellophora europaea (strain CBS 101466) TaxID=1220924 RepID=W2S1E0_CYPE1|nr:uncharacterized protein HMPREF1541_01648 [Cyphellophora europaea CBS 101466]ETN42492.1 hypothetical protein HMPREF1541_01648 [Cyphellophora europaea CBS 101466]
MPSMYAGSTRSSSSTSTSSSDQTYATNITSYSDMRPIARRFESAPSKYGQHVEDPEDLHEGNGDPRSSVETYTSSISSNEDLADQPEYELPNERHRTYETDAMPSTPPDFAKLFPTTRRLLIQHDDSTSDGNMNLRCDTEAVSQYGERLKMTLFHLRMKNLYERQFSLRRYCRDSGREVCSSKKKYAKPIPRTHSRKRPSISKSLSTALHNLGVKTPNRQESGYESEDGQLEQDLRNFTLSSEVKATIPTNIIRLEYSNYAQVELHRRRQDGAKRWDFEYWGEPYSWKRELSYDDGEPIYSYELINLRLGTCVAYIMPDKLDQRQESIENEQGGWIPPSSLRLTEKSISEDLGDVIVSTGLVVLTDDYIKRRWHNAKSARVYVPHDIDPTQAVDQVFSRPSPKIHQRGH